MDRRFLGDTTERGRRCRSLVGIAVVLLMIGHDAMMAGNVHVLPRLAAGHSLASMDSKHHPPEGGASHDQARHRPGAQRASASIVGMGDGTTLPHPASCATTRSAVPGVGSDGGRDGPNIGVDVVALRLHAAPPAVGPCWEPPILPPQTRRAFLQVYRL